MPVTYDSNYADYAVDYLSSRVLAEYSKDTLLGSLAVNASQFVDLNGSYRPGASILINMVQDASTSYVTDVTTNSAIAESKATTTQYTLDLDTVAITSLDHDLIEQTFSNNWQPAIDKIIAKYAADHIGATEANLWSSVFNIAGLTELGDTTTDTALDFDDLAVIDQYFTEADVPGGSMRHLVLPPKMYRELLTSASGEFDLSADENMVRTSAISTKYNLTVHRSNNLPTLATMTNYTAGSLTTTNKVGLAFSDDAVALFNPDFQLGLAGVGIQETVVRNAGFSATLSTSADNTLNVPEVKRVMRSLFGGVIYRPSAVFPIVNGNIS